MEETEFCNEVAVEDDDEEQKTGVGLDPKKPVLKPKGGEGYTEQPGKIGPGKCRYDMNKDK